jgi:hypothetical protein
MRRLICFFVGHRWRPYWTPLRTWMGARCARCRTYRQGGKAFNDAMALAKGEGRGAGGE